MKNKTQHFGGGKPNMGFLPLPPLKREQQGPEMITEGNIDPRTGRLGTEGCSHITGKGSNENETLTSWAHTWDFSSQ